MLPIALAWDAGCLLYQKQPALCSTIGGLRSAWHGLRIVHASCLRGPCSPPCSMARYGPSTLYGCALLGSGEGDRKMLGSPGWTLTAMNYKKGRLFTMFVHFPIHDAQDPLEEPKHSINHPKIK